MPDKIKDVYDLISDKGYFANENEFRTFVSDPIKRKEAYSLISDDGFFKDENEFNSFISEPVKKKEPTAPSIPNFSTSLGGDMQPLPSGAKNISQSPLQSNLKSEIPTYIDPTKPLKTKDVIDVNAEKKPFDSEVIRKEREVRLGTHREKIMSSIVKEPDLYTKKASKSHYGTIAVPEMPNIDNISKAIDYYATKLVKQGEYLSPLDKQYLVNSVAQQVKQRKDIADAAANASLRAIKGKELPLYAYTGVTNDKGEVITKGLFQEANEKIVNEQNKEVENYKINSENLTKTVAAEVAPEVNALKLDVKAKAEILNKEVETAFNKSFEEKDKAIYEQYNQLVQSGQMSAEVANNALKIKREELQKQTQAEISAAYAPKFDALNKESNLKSKDIQSAYNRNYLAKANLLKDASNKKLQEIAQKNMVNMPEGYIERWGKDFQESLAEIEKKNVNQAYLEAKRMPVEARLAKAVSFGFGNVLGSIGGAMSFAGLDASAVNDVVIKTTMENELTSSAYYRIKDAEAKANGTPHANFVEKLSDSSWWYDNMGSTAPFMLVTMPLGIASGYGAGSVAKLLGASKRATAIASAVGGGAVSWYGENTLEAGSAFNDAINQGYSEKDASEIAARTFSNNLWTLPLSVFQMMPVFSKSFKFAKALPLEIITGGAEEILQGWSQAEANAAANGFDVSLFEYAKTPQALEEGTIGGAMQAGMAMFALDETPNIDKQISALMSSISVGGEQYARAVLDVMNKNKAITDAQYKEANLQIDYILNGIESVQNFNVDDNLKVGLVSKFAKIGRAKALITDDENDLASQAAKEMIAEQEKEIKEILKGNTPLYLVFQKGNPIPTVATEEQFNTILKDPKLRQEFTLQAINDDALQSKIDETYKTEKPTEEVVNAEQEVIPATETPAAPVSGVSGEIQESGDVAPTDEQILQDVKDKNFVTFEYKDESEVPEQFKDKISSTKVINGVKTIQVTLPKVVADYELSKQTTTKQNDKENGTGVQSNIGEGKEPIKTQPIETTGGEKVETSGNVQASEEEVSKEAGVSNEELLSNLPSSKDNVNNAPVSITDSNDKFGNKKTRYIPFSIIEKAQKNDKYGGQTAKQIADRGGYNDRELDRMYPNWRKEIAELNKPKETTKPIVEQEATKKTTKVTPKEGDTSVTKSARGMIQNMVFKDGEWQIKFGKDFTKVASSVQKEAQDSFNEKNAPVAEVKEQAPVVKEQAAPPVKAEEKPTKEQKEPVKEQTEKEKAKEKAKEELRARASKAKAEAISAAQKVQQALEATGITVEVLDNEQEFQDKLDAEGVNRASSAGKSGVFISKSGKIFINGSKVDANWGSVDVWHEGTHPIINIIRNTNPKLYNSIVDGLNKLVTSNPEIADVLKWAQKNYKGKNTLEDETITETIARIANGNIDISKIPTSLRDKIIDFINEIAKSLGIKPMFKSSNVATFKKIAGEISAALKEGKDISSIVGAENVKSFENKISELIGDGIQGENILEANINPNFIQARVESNVDEVDSTVDVYKTEATVVLPVVPMKDILKKFKGKVTAINSDPTRVGELKLISGKKIFLYGGVDYVSLKENNDNGIGFATTLLSKVDSYTKLLKKFFGNNDGVTLIVSQTPLSLLSNSYSMRYVLDAISQLPASVRRNVEFKKEFFGKDIVALKNALGEKTYNDFLSKYEKLDLGDDAIINKMVEELAYKISEDNSPASFRARGVFVANLLAGINLKSNQASTKGEAGYYSVKPSKFISGELMSRFGLNAEKLFYEIGDKKIVDLYMKKGIWGVTKAGFESNANADYKSIQKKGVSHPLFNSKFASSKSFNLDGIYKIDDLLEPEVMTESKKGVPYIDKKTGESKPYIKKSSLMLAASIYTGGKVKGTPSPVQLSQGKRDAVANENLINGFYSPLEKTINDSKQDKMPAKQWAEKFAKGEEAKWTGLTDWLGSQTGSVSKADIQNYLKNNRIEIVEVEKTDKTTKEQYSENAIKKGNEAGLEVEFGSENEIQITLPGEGYLRQDDVDTKGHREFTSENYNVDISVLEIANELFNENESKRYRSSNEEQVFNTKFSQYQLEGEKENYKEILVTLPNQPISFSERQEFELLRNKRNYELTKEEQNRKEELVSKMKGETNFKSTHFDEANILVHLRMNTRTDSQGNKVLFLEEVQSDWGQKGKKEGFAQTVDEKRIEELGNLIDKQNKIREESQDEKTRLDAIENRTPLVEELKKLREKQKGIPTAPFVMDTNAWTKLGLKVALKEAVAQGVDKIAWTTGEQQNDRYDLSKQVDSITVEQQKNGDKFVSIEMKGQAGESILYYNDNGKITENDGNTIPNTINKNLSDVIGKEITEKILKANKGDKFEGDDLKIGGKGMKGFYGSPTEGSLGIVGEVAKSLTKQEPKTVEIENSNVKKSSIGTGKLFTRNAVENAFKKGMIVKDYNGNILTIDEAIQLAENADSLSDEKYAYATNKESTSTQNSIDITPELKAQVEEGLPQFSQGNRDIQSIADMITETQQKGVLDDNEIAETLENSYSKEEIQEAFDYINNPPVNEPAAKETETVEPSKVESEKVVNSLNTAEVEAVAKALAKEELKGVDKTKNEKEFDKNKNAERNNARNYEAERELKDLKNAATILAITQNINEIRAKLLENGNIKTIDCKWG